MSKVEVIVKINDSDTSKMSEIAAELKQAGMNVESQMAAVGMISGKIDRANISKIEAVKGVSYVEESQSLSADE